MKSHDSFKTRTILITAIVIQALALTSCRHEHPSKDEQPLLGITTSQLMNRIEGANSPEQAAIALAEGISEKSPAKFLRHLCLGVCDGPISTVNKYAECMHKKNLTDDSGAYSTLDLPSRIIADSGDAIETQAFDQQDPRVGQLSSQMLSTYYGESFQCVWVTVQARVKHHYTFRVVVTSVSGRWYAIPRCKSATSFYEIADAMQQRRKKKT